MEIAFDSTLMTNILLTMLIAYLLSEKILSIFRG